MVTLRTLTIATLITFLSHLGVTLAGAGAQVHACVHLSNSVKDPFTVNFDPNNGANQCMNQVGNYQSVTVSSSGITCAYIGYVEAKFSSSGGDLCATDPSYWNIGYSTEKLRIPKSGNIKSRWRKQWASPVNEIAIKQGPPGNMVCGSQPLCYSQMFTWDEGTVPNVYFVFQPDKQDSAYIEVEYKEDSSPIEEQTSERASQVVINRRRMKKKSNIAE
ncbi:hypothetical protein TWF788_009373 [Orbilia oligospora]|uniref:Uncharacterized protein n=1 Tax=Orbilia oligospora TaxID=2813651 RepID=A0A6G1LX32_ORBOL|nr:hypothetical protein TWF788_009373 [Orbilia oligospora]KAF3202406.1 hypothetical protein TWF191_002966 [Orbilia oligospora]KAF3237063.1 hypothetical protein TWF192_011227 [Orbilia oligospora]